MVSPKYSSLGVALFRECGPNVASNTALLEDGFFAADMIGDTITVLKGTAAQGPDTPPFASP